MKNMEHFVMYR